MLLELIRGPLCKDYATLDLRGVHIILLEALDRLHTTLPQCLGGYALKRLEKMGVQVHLRAMVSEISRDAVRLKDGTLIPTETVIWTAGVRGVVGRRWDLTATRNMRIALLAPLEVPDYPRIYVVGDLAGVEQNGRPLPKLAPVAILAGTAATALCLLRARGNDDHRAQCRRGIHLGPHLHRIRCLVALARRSHL
jgi:NADH dehydrogenase